MQLQDVMVKLHALSDLSTIQMYSNTPQSPLLKENWSSVCFRWLIPRWLTTLYKPQTLFNIQWDVRKHGKYEWWTEKYSKGTTHGLLQGTILAFAWKYWEKPWKISVRIPPILLLQLIYLVHGLDKRLDWLTSHSQCLSLYLFNHLSHRTHQ